MWNPRLRSNPPPTSTKTKPSRKDDKKKDPTLNDALDMFSKFAQRFEEFADKNATPVKPAAHVIPEVVKYRLQIGASSTCDTMTVEQLNCIIKGEQKLGAKVLQLLVKMSRAAYGSNKPVEWWATLQRVAINVLIRERIETIILKYNVTNLNVPEKMRNDDISVVRAYFHAFGDEMNFLDLAILGRIQITYEDEFEPEEWWEWEIDDYTTIKARKARSASEKRTMNYGVEMMANPNLVFRLRRRTSALDFLKIISLPEIFARLDREDITPSDSTALERLSKMSLRQVLKIQMAKARSEKSDR